MTEVFSIRKSNDYLHGLLEKPDADDQKQKKALLFIHGAGGHRTGPHDMFVMFSRNLSKSGYYCVRFDCRGWGYSGTDEHGYNHRTIIEDIELVKSYLESKYRIDDISLLGICMGAKIALYYTKNSTFPINKLILLSSSALRSMDKSNEVIIKEVGLSSKIYLKKILNANTWKKFFLGEIHFRKIFLSIFKPLTFFRIKKRKLQTKPIPVLRGFENLKGDVLIIHAEKDPETLTALPQLQKLFSSFNIQYTANIIKGANHSFYSMVWKNEVFALIKNWL